MKLGVDRLFGSTHKMGSGTNVQERLIALHHLDAPWRPAGVEQREGCILRQGNRNTEVKIRSVEHTVQSLGEIAADLETAIADANKISSDLNAQLGQSFE